MQVRALMSGAVATVGPDDSVALAAKAMQQAGATAVVVVDGSGAPVGLLTERDLVQVLVDRADPEATPVRDRMLGRPVTVTPDTDGVEAWELMGQEEVRHLPVVEAGTVVGLVESADPRLALHFDRRKPHRLPEGASIATTRRAAPDLTFRGPYADGPPPEALVVDAPSLTAFGLGELRRMVTTGWVLTVCILGAVLRRRLRVVFRRPHDGWFETASHGAVDAFEKLGPAWVKLGQIIASSPGIFPEPLAKACQRTLDDVPPFDAATARRIIEEDLGRPVEELFRSFDDRPLSAASVGQVHACVLPDGRQAVLKLQRPGVRDLFMVDLRIMYRLAKILTRVDALRSANPVAIVEDTHAINFSELNPALEARRQADFREKIWAFGDNKWITAPEVYWNWCGPRIICMERMSGIPMDEFEEMARRGIDGELILRRGAKVWLESVCIHGPFHGDMHAGNIWSLDDGRSAYLDFGIMGELAPEFRSVIEDILYTTMIDGDFTRIARAYRRVGVFPDDMGTDEELGMRLQMILGPMLQAGISGMNLGEMLKMSIDLMDNYAATAPKEMVLIAKQLAYIERYAKGLAPDYQLIQDVFLIKNIFPEAASRKAEELGITFPE